MLVAKVLGKQIESGGVQAGEQPSKPFTAIQAAGQPAKQSGVCYSHQVDQFDQAEMERRVNLLQTDR